MVGRLIFYFGRGFVYLFVGGFVSCIVSVGFEDFWVFVFFRVDFFSFFWLSL